MPSGQQQPWLRAMQEGQQSFQQGSFGDAAQAFTRATRLAPSRAEGWVNLGAALVESSQYDSAVTALQKAKSLNPRLMAAHMALGDAMRQLGDLPEAIASYREAVSLQRNPLALNKLACALRIDARPEEAAALYQEALRMAPGFTLAQVNLATAQVELQRFDQAAQQLKALEDAQLPPIERREVESTQLALSEYFRLNQALATTLEKGELAALEAVLQATPEPRLQSDEGILKAIRRYADSAHALPPLPSPEPERPILPEDWPLIEAMFMVPVVDGVPGYLKTKADLAAGREATGDLLESVNMEPVIRAARAAHGDLNDPIKAELHLRHWHALASRGVPGFTPGHFKITGNLARTSPATRRAEPHLVTGTLRRFINEIYIDLPPGLPRAAVAWMAICDIHAFADGNGRLGITWLNRELEWAGGMPALFPRRMGIRGQLGAATREVRGNGGDVSVLVPVFAEAQQYAREFCCHELARH